MASVLSPVVVCLVEGSNWSPICQDIVGAGLLWLVMQVIVSSWSSATFSIIWSSTVPWDAVFRVMVEGGTKKGLLVRPMD